MLFCAKFKVIKMAGWIDGWVNRNDTAGVWAWVCV